MTIPVKGTSLRFALRWVLLIVLICGTGVTALYLNSPNIEKAEVYDGLRSREFKSQPYMVNTGGASRDLIMLTVQYSSWQNGTFAVEMNDACITDLAVLQQGAKIHILKAAYARPQCGEVIFNLASLLLPGTNQILLEVRSAKPKETEVYMTPVLLGAQAVSTLACLCIFSVFAAALVAIGRRAGLGLPACAILAAGLACYALLLHLRPNLEYSNDHIGHIAYIRYMLTGWMHPYGYDGWEHFHPPLYYFLASRFFRLAGAGGVVAPLTWVRLLALFFYMAYCFFGVLTLHEASPRKKGLAYHTGIMLLVFWPIGPVIATRISNDIAVYAAWACAFYFLTRWHCRHRDSDMRWAVIWTGTAFMFKTSAIMLVAVTGASIFFRIVIKKMAWSALSCRKTWLAMGFFIVCIAENTGRYIGLLTHGRNVSDYLTDDIHEHHPITYFTHFDPGNYITHPVVTFDKEPTYFNYFLKTVLYNEQQLDGMFWLPSLLNILLLILLCVTIFWTVKTCARDRLAFATLAPFIFGVLIPPLGPYIFMGLKRYMFCQSFRFIVPTLIPFILLYARGLQLPCTTRTDRLFHGIGLTAGIGMVAGSIIMNGWLYSHGHFQ